MDIFEKFNLDDTPLGKYYEFLYETSCTPQVRGRIGPHMKFMGKEMIVWSLNNYRIS